VEGGDGMTPPVLELRDVRLRRGAREILRGVTFTAGRGEIVVIMGPSGSGKTTILRAIAGLDRHDSGHIAVKDGRAGMVFQFHCLFEHLSAIDNVCLAPVHAHGVARGDAVRRAHELMAAVGVDHRASAMPRELSGGEAQRVAIARALAVDPGVLLLDEPTASLDPDRRAELGALLVDLARQGRTLVIATHDEDFARAFATRTLRLNDGVVS
jgi:ABC-type polar amino acid transport system ATPase subunit